MVPFIGFCRAARYPAPTRDICTVLASGGEEGYGGNNVN